jgi:hypothetical protein
VPPGRLRAHLATPELTGPMPADLAALLVAAEIAVPTPALDVRR